MKVVCIENVDWRYRNKWYRRFPWSKKKNAPAIGPKKDDVVTVESEYWAEGKCFYRLLEWPIQPDGGYDSAFFMPLRESATDYEEVTFLELVKEKAAPSVN